MFIVAVVGVVCCMCSCVVCFVLCVCVGVRVLCELCLSVGDVVLCCLTIFELVSPARFGWFVVLCYFMCVMRCSDLFMCCLCGVLLRVCVSACVSVVVCVVLVCVVAMCCVWFCCLVWCGLLLLCVFV